MRNLKQEILRDIQKGHILDFSELIFFVFSQKMIEKFNRKMQFTFFPPQFSSSIKLIQSFSRLIYLPFISPFIFQSQHGLRDYINSSEYHFFIHPHSFLKHSLTLSTSTLSEIHIFFNLTKHSVFMCQDDSVSLSYVVFIS